MDDKELRDQEASLFAVGLLVPEPLVRREFERVFADGSFDPCSEDLLEGFAKLADMFDVTVSLMIFRVVQLGLFDPRSGTVINPYTLDRRENDMRNIDKIKAALEREEALKLQLKNMETQLAVLSIENGRLKDENTSLKEALRDADEEQKTAGSAYMMTLAALAKMNGNELRIPDHIIDSIDTQLEDITNGYDELRQETVFRIVTRGSSKGIILPGRSN